MIYVIEDSTLTGIADAIRSKTGGTSEVPVAEMATQIQNITVGSSVEELQNAMEVSF